MTWSCPHTEGAVNAFAFLMKGRLLLWTLWFLVSLSFFRMQDVGLSQAFT